MEEIGVYNENTYVFIKNGSQIIFWLNGKKMNTDVLSRNLIPKAEVIKINPLGDWNAYLKSFEIYDRILTEQELKMPGVGKRKSQFIFFLWETKMI